MRIQIHASNAFLAASCAAAMSHVISVDHKMALFGMDFVELDNAQKLMERNLLSMKWHNVLDKRLKLRGAWKRVQTEDYALNVKIKFLSMACA